MNEKMNVNETENAIDRFVRDFGVFVEHVKRIADAYESSADSLKRMTIEYSEQIEPDDLFSPKIEPDDPERE